MPPKFTRVFIALKLVAVATTLLITTAGVSYAMPNQQGVAGHLTVFGPAVQGALDGSTPSATYSFDAYAGQPISLRSTAVNGDLMFDLTLSGPDGSVLMRGMTAIDGRTRVIDAFVPPADGTYYATATALNGSSGAFSLSLLAGYAELAVLDDFSGANNSLCLSWSPFVSVDAAADVVNGSLGIQVINEGRLGFFEPDNWTAYGDMYIQADFLIEETPGYHEYGFALRNAPGAESFYTVMFSSKGDWALFYFNGAWNVVQDWTPSPVINGADTTPSVGVFVDGNTFRVYFNGREVGSVSDAGTVAQQSGGFGIVAATSPEDDGVLIAYVDNLTVTTPAEPYGAMASLPNSSAMVTTP